MQDALRHAQVAVERDTAGDAAGAATEYAAAAAALLRLAEGNAAQKEALEGRAAEYSARAAALREIVSEPPTTAAVTAAPSLEQRLDRLKGPQVQVDEAGLEGRLARLTGEPAPEPAPAPAPGGGAMSAGDAQRYEQDARAALGLGGHGAGGGDSEVDRLLADAVAANADAHRTGARIDGAHNCSSGCLFNVATDRGEYDDLAATNSQRVADMTQLLAEESERFFVNRDKGSDACPDGIEMSCGCWMAINKYGGAFGPFQNVTPP